MDDLTPQERAALVTLEIIRRGGTNNQRVRELTGISGRDGALRLLCLLSRHVPIYYDRHKDWWELITGAL